MKVTPLLLPAVLLMSSLLLALSIHAQAQKTGVEKLTEVVVQPVSEQALHTTVEALGNLRANESIELTSNVTNTITRINFEDGQRVTKGQVLVEMTSAEESALLDEARINADEAKKQLDRVVALEKSGAASQSLLDQRIREYQSARSRYYATESRLKDLILLAPFNGVLGLRNTSVGALVSPGDVITTLNDDHKMKLDFTVPAIFLRSLAVGLPITAYSRDLGDKVFKGEVFSIDNQIDEVTRSIKVRALLDNKDHELKQGMLMRVDMNTDERSALVISEAALVPLGSNNFVFVITKQGADTLVERREVKIGERFAGRVEVLDGLVAGERIITHGLQKIRAGQKVTVLREEMPAGQEKNNGAHLSDSLIQPQRG